MQISHILVRRIGSKRHHQEAWKHSYQWILRRILLPGDDASGREYWATAVVKWCPPSNHWVCNPSTRYEFKTSNACFACNPNLYYQQYMKRLSGWLTFNQLTNSIGILNKIQLNRYQKCINTKHQAVLIWSVPFENYTFASARYWHIWGQLSEMLCVKGSKIYPPVERCILES